MGEGGGGGNTYWAYFFKNRTTLLEIWASSERNLKCSRITFGLKQRDLINSHITLMGRNKGKQYHSLDGRIEEHRAYSFLKTVNFLKD